MNLAADFQPDTQALLAPIAGDLPAGPSMRYDPLYMAIRSAREEEDAKLPMREWERPLKKADWQSVADNASVLLGTRSKDFQVAAWLCEAWIHRHQLAGFNAAVVLMNGLVDRYWDSAHPQIEEDDDEARVAPFFWMNENLPRVLMLNVSLLSLPERMPSTVCTFDWDQALALEKHKVEAKGKKPTPAQISPIPTRSEIVAGANGKNLQALIQHRQLLDEGVQAWELFTQQLNGKMGMQAPSVAKVLEMLQRMRRVCNTLIDGREPVPVVATASMSPMPTPAVVAATPPSPPGPADPTHPSSAESLHTMGPINSREDAYRMLEAVAQYLQKTEPHSPTPYLVMRAVTWGRMSLGDLMQEIVREEGDMSRYFSLLGIKEPRN
jgi:type VI secretion system protein ImpA